MPHDLKPYLKDGSDGEFIVGSYSAPTNYRGPEAVVFMDSEWLYISTDEYEGTAMLNIESLPMLRVALQRLEQQLNIQNRAP